MKSSLMVISLLSMATATYAQDVAQTVTKPSMKRSNEIGLMAQLNFNDDNNTNMAGLQYKHWVTPNMGIRILAAYSQYEKPGTAFFTGKIGDTVFERNSRTTIPMAFIGAGVDLQRRFYKKTYLYAAIEVRAGYGKGWSNPMISKTVQNDSVNYVYTAGTGPELKGATMLTVQAVPVIGAKMQFKRISFGTEASFVCAAVNNISNIPYTASGTSVDINVGQLTQRFFIHYRF